MIRIQELHKQRDFLFNDLVNAKTTKEQKELIAVLQSVNKKIRNHPDYLDQFNKISLFERYVIKLYSTKQRIFSWIRRRIKNVNKFVRR